MAESEAGKRNARLRVLVIDDQPVIRAVVRRLLGELGFKEVSEASDGLAGLEVLWRAAPDLIICDIEMKPMNGLEFVEALQRRGYYGANRIPTIFLTAHAEREIVLRAKAVGADAFLVKPVQRNDLAARIEAVLARKGL